MATSAEMKKELTDTQTALAEAKDELAKMTKVRDEAFAVIKEQRGLASEDGEALKKELEARDAEVKTVRDELNEMVSTNKTLQAEIKELTVRVTQSTSANSSHEMQTLRAELNEYRQKAESYDTVVQERDTLRTAYEGLRNIELPQGEEEPIDLFPTSWASHGPLKGNTIYLINVDGSDEPAHAHLIGDNRGSSRNIIIYSHKDHSTVLDGGTLARDQEGRIIIEMPAAAFV